MSKPRMVLPNCKVCKYSEICEKEKVDRKSLFCMLNFYKNDFVFDYYNNHLDEYGMTEEQLIYELSKEKNQS